jgi:hypothetical protein
LHVSEKQEVSPQSVMVTSYKVMFFNVTQKWLSSLSSLYKWWFSCTISILKVLFLLFPPSVACPRNSAFSCWIMVIPLFCVFNHHGNCPWCFLIHYSLTHCNILPQYDFQFWKNGPLALAQKSLDIIYQWTTDSVSTSIAWGGWEVTVPLTTSNLPFALHSTVKL